MKFSRIMLTGAALVMALVTQVFADGTGASQRNGSYFNDKNGAKTDASGNAYMNDASRDRDYKTWQTVVNDTVSNVTADSLLTPFYTAPYRRFWLRVQVTWPNAVHDSLGQRQKFCRVAVQIRSHLTAQVDSLNTNPWYVFGDSLRNNSAANGLDSLSYRMSTLTGVGANTAAAQTSPLPSEIVFTAFRTQHGTGATGSNYYGEPTNFWIPLADRRGVYYWGPYTTIRARLMNNYLINITEQPRIVVDLVGTAN